MGDTGDREASVEATLKEAMIRRVPVNIQTGNVNHPWRGPIRTLTNKQVHIIDGWGAPVIINIADIDDAWIGG